MGNIFPLGNQVDARLVESSGSIFGESAGSSKNKERRKVDTARRDNLDLVLERNKE